MRGIEDRDAIGNKLSKTAVACVESAALHRAHMSSPRPSGCETKGGDRGIRRRTQAFLTFDHEFFHKTEKQKKKKNVSYMQLYARV